MSTPELVRVSVDAGVAVLTLDNPPLNVVTLELTSRLRAALDRLAADPAARVLVVTGAGTRAMPMLTSSRAASSSSNRVRAVRMHRITPSTQTSVPSTMTTSR